MIHFFFWGILIVIAAFAIRMFHPEDHSALIAVLVNTEAFHVGAHLFLYGMLAWLGMRRWRAGRVLVLVMGIAGLQELTQTAGSRAWGKAEFFDLSVDLIAAGTVVLVETVRRRK